MSKDKLNYIILKPEEMRLKFTEFVMMNQPLALDEAAASLLQSEKFNFSKFLIFDIKMLLQIKILIESWRNKIKTKECHLETGKKTANNQLNQYHQTKALIQNQKENKIENPTEAKDNHNHKHQKM